MSTRATRARSRTACVALVVTVVVLAAAGCGDDDTAAGDTSAPDAAAGSAGADAGYPVTVESCGTDYTFEGPPEQVLLGWPESMETLMALGVDDTVVGYLGGGLSALPEGAPEVPEVSPDYAASREVVVAAGADLLVLNDLSAVAGEGGGVGLDDLEVAGTNVFVLGDYCGPEGPAAPETTEVVLDDIRDLGVIFGVTDRAEELVAEIDDRLTAAATTGADRPTAFVQVHDGTLYALSGSSYAAVLDALNLDNVFDGIDGNFSEISAEEVLTLAPDVVIVVHDDTETDADEAITEVSEMLEQSPAVEDGTVIPVTYSAMSASGTTLIDIIEDVAAAL
jgi:iron complex transport system substrate-binding protein